MNDLNVFKPDFSPWKYPSNWYRNIRLFFRQFKWAYQRVTKGFCDPDWWDLDIHLTKLIADVLDEMINKSISYPGTDEFSTPEIWNEYLATIVKKLRYSISELPNEHQEAYYKTLEGSDWLDHINNKTPEDKEIFDKYFAIDCENEKLKQQALYEALDMLKHVWYQLWD